MKGSCPNQCPVECDEDEIWCPGGSDSTGCPLPPKCLPKLNSNGCENFCPPMCPKDMDHCPGFLDEFGCPTQHMCIYQYPGCPKYCPMDCPEGNYTCPMCGPEECPVPGECLPEVEGCDDHCPVVCGKGEITCTMGPIPTKCPHENEYCLKNYDWKCPAICPIECAFGYIKCSDGTDSKGCPLEDYCIPEEDSITGLPAKCPTKCPPEAIECPVSVNSNEKTCITRPDDLPASCNFECPIVCDEGEILCPGPEIDGCPSPGTCTPLQNSTCQLDPAIQCPTMYCPMDQQMCSKPNQIDGCPDRKFCIPNTDDKNCPKHCPKHCSNEEIKCPSDLDANGCKGDKYCSPIQNMSCPLAPEVQCPMIPCPDDEQSCSKSIGIEGCPDKKFCIPMKDEKNCTKYCPLDCPSDQILCPGYVDSFGCLGPSSCMPIKNASCPLTPEVQCPSPSCPIDEQSCSVSSGIEGCPNKKYCLPIKDENNCTNYCPVECTSDQVLCSGYPNGHCPALDYCLNSTGNCPQTCPTQCLNDSLSCHIGWGEGGCDLGYKCLSSSCKGCPPKVDAGIKMDCAYDEVSCPVTFQNECTETEVCIKNHTGQACDVNICPAFCKENEFVCSDWPSVFNGSCPRFSEYCVPFIYDGKCPGQCPVECPSDWFKCPDYTDSDGCFQAGSCFAPNPNCPSTTNQCPIICGPEEIYCSKGYDENYCYLGGECVPKSCRGCPPIGGNSSLNSETCPSHSVLCAGPENDVCPFKEVCVFTGHFDETCDIDICPAWCKEDEITCHGHGFDWLYDFNITFWQTCPKFKEYCIPEFDNKGCQNMCPVECPTGYIECPGGQDFNGCDILSGRSC